MMLNSCSSDKLPTRGCFNPSANTPGGYNLLEKIEAVSISRACCSKISPKRLLSAHSASAMIPLTKSRIFLANDAMTASYNTN